MNYRKRMYLESAVVLAYTAMNMKVLWPFVAKQQLLFGASVSSEGSPNLLAIVLGLFLNAALVMMWLRKMKGPDSQ